MAECCWSWSSPLAIGATSINERTKATHASRSTLMLALRHRQTPTPRDSISEPAFRRSARGWNLSLQWLGELLRRGMRWPSLRSGSLGVVTIVGKSQFAEDRAQLATHLARIAREVADDDPTGIRVVAGLEQLDA